MKAITAKLIDSAVRSRYLVLLVWSLPWLLRGLAYHVPHEDWFYLEIGARTLLHHRQTPIAGPPLHVYVTDFQVQMGPPALLLGGLSQYLPQQLGGHVAGVVLALLVLPTLWCLERAVARHLDPRATSRRLLLAGLVVVPAWTYEAQYWGHVDDVVALVAMAATCLLVSRGDHEIAAGLVLGTGVAAKPWLVILLPLLLAYPRVRSPRAVAAFIVAALGWWLPFVLAAPGTIGSLTSLQLHIVNEPTWRLIGLHGYAPNWIRPLQLLGGIVLATVVVRRAGWKAVPFVALAWRVTTDPYDWPYYAIGPLVGAALWDLQRRGHRWWSVLPWATLSAFGAELLLERELPAVTPAARLCWFLVLTAVLLRAGRRDVAGDGEQTGSLDLPPRISAVRPATAAAEPRMPVPLD